LRAVSHDQHLHVDYFHDAAPEPGPAEQERARKQMVFNNYGFEKVERLAGNIGYLDLRAFAAAELAKETGVAAMNLLANSDAARSVPGETRDAAIRTRTHPGSSLGVGP